MSKRIIFSCIALFGCLSVAVPTNVAVATPDEFRAALFADCERQTGSKKGSCMRGRVQVFDERNATARTNYKNCLKGGASRGECDAKQNKYWKDLQEMFGL